MRIMKNGEIRSLFINKKESINLDNWMTAKNYPTKGFAVRPGFHALAKPDAPHLGKKGRGWFEVEVKEYQIFERPQSQGGMWYLAKKMKVNRRIKDSEVDDLLRSNKNKLEVE